MKLFTKFLALGLVLLLVPIVVSAQQYERTDSYSLWLGAHYTDFSDYTKKVGEYNLGEDEALPEFRFSYLSRYKNSIFSLGGHYYDDKNIDGKLTSRVGNKFSADFQYRSLIKQEGQDLLENLSARESVGGSPGGKMLTNEVLDPGADYNTHRQEIQSRMKVLLSEKSNLRLMVAHRTILKSGSEQKIASNHCFSCHMTSQTGKVDNRTHQLQASLEGQAGEVDLGYTFGYRYYANDAPDAMAYYDVAKHPTLGTAASEFGSRVNYDDATLVFSTLPKTEKTSHKVNVKSKVGEGNFAGTVGYSKTKNKLNLLTTDAWMGAANYSVMLDPTTRLVTKLSGRVISADDPFIDLPTYRDGATDGNEMDFDYTRYSVKDRSETKISAEITKRVNPKVTLSILGGYNMVNRDDYPIFEDGINTKTIIGQAKLRYRKGLKYTSKVKYRFEKITDPFVSARGLFEASGYQNPLLDPLTPTSTWVFYFQREDLRYQNITTMPTQVHEFDWSSNYRPNNRYNLTVGLKGQYDKNGDLDSLDVKHLTYQPNLALSVTANDKLAFSLGYDYLYSKSRLPVAVALFDG